MPPAALLKQGLRAGLISRVLAGTVDVVVAVVLLCTGYLALVGLRFLLSPSTFRFPSPSGASFLAAFLAVQVLYLTACWATTGRTYGDRLMGLRVVGRRGDRLHWLTAFVRGVAYAFFPIGLLWVAVSRENRSLQDVVLRSSVVYDWNE